MNNKKKYSEYVISFCVPCLVFTLLLAVFKIAPFGDYTLFFNDMSGQYISFFSYLKQMLMGEKSSLYTFSKLIGGDLQGWISYYLLSPFNFIVLLFKTSDMALAASALTLAKLGSCGLTSYIFLSKKSDSMPLKLIFSTAYALMAYNIVYAQNIMWLDGVIILPIIAIGIDDIIDKNKYLTYIMALAYGIITNYYIGYMLCGFSVIYFLFKLLLKDGVVLKEKAKKLGIFTYGSLTGGAISAFVLLPTIKSLEGTTKQSLPLNELISLSTNLRMRELVKHIFFPSATLNDFSTNLPNVYVGLVVLIMMLLFFVSRKIHWKEKLLAFGIVIFFIASFYFTTPNLAWHGFMYPVCFSFRFSFIFSFFVILFAFRFMQTMDIDNKKLLLYGALVVNTAFIFAFAFNNFRTAYLTENSFKTFYNDVNPSVQAVKSLEEDGFYRIEKDFAYSLNDAMTFGYNGLEHYSSGEKLITRKLPKIMGYPVREAYGKYGNGSTLSADSFWGIKYLMTHGEGKHGTEKINEINGVSTYKNPYALPLAIISDREILDLRTSTLHMSDAAGEILSCALKEAYSFVNTQENTEG
ncbi:MAG: YfhO family protein [Oscillospiraceae bacterium]